MKLLREQAGRYGKSGFHAFVYILDGTPEQLKALNKELKADNVALALIPKADKKETLELYDIDPKAESTVIVYKSRTVTKTFTNFKDNKHGKSLRNAISKVCE